MHTFMNFMQIAGKNRRARQACIHMYSYSILNLHTQTGVDEEDADWSKTCIKEIPNIHYSQNYIHTYLIPIANEFGFKSYRKYWSIKYNKVLVIANRKRKY